MSPWIAVSCSTDGSRLGCGRCPLPYSCSYLAYMTRSIFSSKTSTSVSSIWLRIWDSFTFLAATEEAAVGCGVPGLCPVFTPIISLQILAISFALPNSPNDGARLEVTAPVVESKATAICQRPSAASASACVMTPNVAGLSLAWYPICVKSDPRTVVRSASVPVISTKVAMSPIVVNVSTCADVGSPICNRDAGTWRQLQLWLWWWKASPTAANGAPNDENGICTNANNEENYDVGGSRCAEDSWCKHERSGHGIEWNKDSPTWAKMAYSSGWQLKPSHPTKAQPLLQQTCSLHQQQQQQQEQEQEQEHMIPCNLRAGGPCRGAAWITQHDLFSSSNSLADDKSTLPSTFYLHLPWKLWTKPMHLSNKSNAVAASFVSGYDMGKAMQLGTEIWCCHSWHETDI